MCVSPVSDQMSSNDQTGGYVKDGHPVKYHSEQYSLCVCAFKQIRCLTLCNMSFCTALSFACSCLKEGDFKIIFYSGSMCFELQISAYSYGLIVSVFQFTVMAILRVCAYPTTFFTSTLAFTAYLTILYFK